MPKMIPDHADAVQYRVYYEDTDAAGVVYYANYLKYAERARTEFLRVRGVDQTTLAREEHLIFVVRHVEMDLKLPARLDDLLTIHSYIIDIKGAKAEMWQVVTRDDVELNRMKITIVAVDNQKICARRFPAELEQLLLSSAI